MIVHYLNIVGVSVAPHEAEPPLIVNPDAMLSFPVTVQGLQMVAWWRG